MAGMFPDLLSGGVVIRNAEGVCIPVVGVQNAYCPPASFVTSCEITALPSDCTGRITAAQINGIVSELLCLGEAFDPDGPWNCESGCNLATMFTTWSEGITAFFVDQSTIVGAGTSIDPWRASPLGVVAAICADPTAGPELAGCLISAQIGNVITQGVDGRLFVAQGATGVPDDAGTLPLGNGAGWTPLDVGAAGMQIIQDPSGQVTHDLVVAVPGLLRNRNLDFVMLTDRMSPTLQDEYRANANPDITQALIDMDASLAPNGEAFIPLRNGIVSGQCPKQPGTRWRGLGSNILYGWTNTFNGSVFPIIGGAASRGGLVTGLRVTNTPVACPDAILFDLDEVFTHFFDDCRIGLCDFAVYGIDCKALRFGMNFYPFSSLTDSIMLEGTSITANTDHCFGDAQMDGARAGLHVKTGATQRFSCQTRPQGSGVANLLLDAVYDAQILGGYNDSAIIFGDDDGGDGIRMINCQRSRVAFVTMYSNGDNEDPTRAMIRIATTNGISQDLYITQNSMTESPLAPMIGITIQTPVGEVSPGVPAFNRRLFIEGNKLNGVTSKMAGLANVGAGGRLTNNDGVSDLLGVGDSGLTPITVNPNVRIVRIVGQNNNRDLILPGEGNYNSKTLEVWMESGTGTVAILQPNGVTVLTTMTAGQRRTFVVSAQNNVTTAATWA